MKKKQLLFGLLGLAVSLGCIYTFKTPGVMPSPPKVWVQTQKVVEASMPIETHAIGTLVANSVEVSPESAGHVQQVFFKDGAEVKKGDVLIQLDDAVSKAQYQAALAKLTFSQSNYKRMITLSKSNIISKQDLDKAEADLKSVQADADEKRELLSQMKMVAPFDGVLGKSNVAVGNYVTVGQPLVTITNTKHLHVEYSVPEKFYPLLKKGQIVKVFMTAYPKQTFSGAVAFISPTINADNRSVSLYAEVPNDENLLASGMYVEVTQSLQGEESAVIVPARSLVPVLDGEQIFKVVDGKAVAQSVVLGKRLLNGVQILEGIKVGDKIITDGQLKVKTGMPVSEKA